MSLIRSGEYEKAFQLVLDATPLVGTLGRACYAPCEVECTRGSLEGPLPIRRLKRFIADVHYEKFDGPGVAIPAPNGHRVAVVGSGPAGLTAAWQLARKGYAVKIFEAAPKAGGFLRLAIPAYRLPSEVVEQDIANVTALGVEIATSAPVRDLAALHGEGYEAVLLATGTPLSTKLGVPGDQLDGVLSGVAFLRAVKLGEGVDLSGPPGRRHRWRQRRHGHRPDGPPARRARRHRRLPAQPRRDAGPPCRGRRHGEGRRRVRLPGGARRGARRRPRARSRGLRCSRMAPADARRDRAGASPSPSRAATSTSPAT